MDSDAASLCLEDMRTVRLGVNEILRMFRNGTLMVANSTPQLTRPPTSDSSWMKSCSDADNRSLKIWRLLVEWNETSTCFLPVANLPTVSSFSADHLSNAAPLPVSSLAEAHPPPDSLHPEVPPLQEKLPNCPTSPSEALVILSLASLAVWLAVVILTLLWMRMTDLRYKPCVVS